MPHSALSYFRLKLTASVIRFFASWTAAPPAKPDETYQFKSRDNKRQVIVHVYRPKSLNKPSPVLLNWHGSGFVIPMHGSDDLFCRHIAQGTNYVVLDASYALAPEYPFPAALEDVEDLILQVVGSREEYDASNIVVSGFSAGANLALAAASNPNSTIPTGAIRAAIALYPPCDLSVSPGAKRAPDGSVGTIPPFLANLFNTCYITPDADAKDPRISVLRADLKEFPSNVLIITAGKDNLALEAEELADKLSAQGKNVTKKRIEGVDHAWDKAAKDNTADAKERDAAYDLAVEFLSNLRP